MTDTIHTKVVPVDAITTGDIVLMLYTDGTLSLAICTCGPIAYERQGGQGAKLTSECGKFTQFPFYPTSNTLLLVIANVGDVEPNPVRQLLNWRRKFEK